MPCSIRALRTTRWSPENLAYDFTRGMPPTPVIVFLAKDALRGLTQGVLGTLIKSTTSNQDLLDTIRSVLKQPAVA